MIMAMRLTFFTLSFILICDGLKDVLANKNVKFTRNATFDGFNCTANQTVFNGEDVESKLVCTSMCSVLPLCFGVFYHPEEQDCIGCSFYMDVNAPARTGTTFHIRKGYERIEETMTWDEAKEHCIEIGGHLAYVKSLHEQGFVNELIDQANVGDISVWIGASDTMTEGTFIWEDGTTFSGAYTYWGPNQPNNYNNQDCIEIIKYNGIWKWNDATCSSAALSLCEFY